MRRYLTALRPVYVPFREAEPDQLHDAWCPATAAKRHPEGQRDDGLTRDGRVTARRERIFLGLKTLFLGDLQVFVPAYTPFLKLCHGTRHTGTTHLDDAVDNKYDTLS